MYQDLHSHTLLSDGKTTYKESLDACFDNNISVVAFTDHDLVPEEKELALLNDLKNHQTQWIVGTEISCTPPKELAGKSIHQLHLVGLFIDPANKTLIDYGHEVVADCTNRMKKMVKAMAGYGFKISFDDVLKMATGKSIQRPHLVDALLARKKNHQRMQFFVDDLKQKSKTDHDLAKLYEKVKQSMAVEPENPYRQPFYQLFFSRNVPYPGVYFERQVSVDLDKASGMIRAAGGVSILAHWSECKNNFPLLTLDRILKEKRLDGAEIVYDLYRIVMGEKDQLKKEQEAVKRLVEKYKALPSGGSDAHAASGFAKFVEQEWMAIQTIGMAQNIIEKTDGLCLDWSTIKT